MLLLELIASGRYQSIEEIIADVDHPRPVEPAIPEHVEINDLAAEQGIEPITDYRSLSADIFRSGETTEEFLSFLYADRDSDAPRVG